MRLLVWMILLATAAVLAANVLGANEGLVSFYREGWRLDMSLNLFLLLFVVLGLAVMLAIQAMQGLVELPEKARRWRVSRRDRSAQASLRDALSQYFGGRFSRAGRSAHKALAIQANNHDLEQDAEFTVLAHVLAAGSAHRLQDRHARDQHLEQALVGVPSPNAAARAAQDGARLLAAEWALDDRDADRAFQMLSRLPSGLARRTQALRLRLQAARWSGQGLEALKTARLLAKHGGIAKVAAVGLLRSLAFEVLDGTRDADQLRRVWAQFDPADRKDPFVAARAARRLADVGAFEEARAWLKPFWEAWASWSAEERTELCRALVSCLSGLPAEWLPRLEAMNLAQGREPWTSFAMGCAMYERQLWGKALVLLTAAAESEVLEPAARRRAWCLLADLAREQGDADKAAGCFERAARLA
jgi:HemY protein